MKTQEIVTNDLAEFGLREIEMVEDLLKAWREQGLPKDFNFDEVRPHMNRNSGNVFLSNSDYQVAMMNGEKLESFYSCPECGHEGFIEDMEHNKKNKECKEYLKQIKAGQ